jgi:NADH:ubiquinone oxidoreductase subunit 6 (subunit J)
MEAGKASVPVCRIARNDEHERINLLFTIFAILTVAGAAAAMSLRNLVHSVLALTVAFAGLAAVYLQLGAQFVGLAQILVYVGAVAILIVFAILLTRDAGAASQSIISSSWIASGTVALVIFGILAWAIWHSATLQRAVLPQPEAPMQQIGSALMLRFALPLEIIGVLLTVALLGAVTIAMREKKEMR